MIILLHSVTLLTDYPVGFPSNSVKTDKKFSIAFDADVLLEVLKSRCWSTLVSDRFVDLEME